MLHILLQTCQGNLYYLERHITFKSSKYLFPSVLHSVFQSTPHFSNTQFKVHRSIHEMLIAKQCSLYFPCFHFRGHPRCQRVHKCTYTIETPIPFKMCTHIYHSDPYPLQKVYTHIPFRPLSPSKSVHTFTFQTPIPFKKCTHIYLSDPYAFQKVYTHIPFRPLSPSKSVHINILS